MFLKNNIRSITIIFSAIIMIWVSSNMKWGDERWKNIITNDGYGYYAYLPAIFIYNDLNFNFVDKLKENGTIPSSAQNFLNPNNEKVNKYYVGAAITQVPFYLLGHLANIITNNPTDGYSNYYPIFFQIGTIFYALLAIYILMLILRKYNIPEMLGAFISFIMMFGTNTYIYIVNEPTMSHIYSFAFTNIFILYTLLYVEKQKNTYFIIAMLSFGMIVLIRPVNGIIILSLPFLAGNFKTLKESFRTLLSKTILLLGGVLSALVIISIQLIIYKIQTGSFFIYSYGDESLNLLEPNMFKFMFSYKKGFFLYTPLLALSLLGSYYIYRKNKFMFISLILFLGIIIYILSSWWNWWYGGSFSSRVMIEYYAFFAISLAFLLKYTRIRKTIITISIIFMLITQFQMYQYTYGYIHWSEMNKERYWNNFLRVDKIINKEKDW
jgi:hypothetical protein